MQQAAREAANRKGPPLYPASTFIASSLVKQHACTGYPSISLNGVSSRNASRMVGYGAIVEWCGYSMFQPSSTSSYTFRGETRYLLNPDEVNNMSHLYGGFVFSSRIISSRNLKCHSRGLNSEKGGIKKFIREILSTAGVVLDVLMLPKKTS